MREFGREVLIDEVDGGIISRYEILSESGSERSRLPESLRAHQERFGWAPFLLAGDRGLYSTENEKTAQQAGVKRVGISSKLLAPMFKRSWTFSDAARRTAYQ